MAGQRSLILILGLCMFSLSQAADLQLQSGTQRTPLLELYTSEGCSSCPPADRWLGTFRQHSQLWSKIIPIAFHVDYWDYIGWKDPFATAAYTWRQRQHARNLKMSQVYTPGFFINGEEWRGWFRNPELPVENDAPDSGVLSLRVEGNTVTLHFAPTAAADIKHVYNIAILGFDQKNPIRSGENAGKILQHDFVVIGDSSGYLERNGDGLTIRTTLPETRFESEQQAIVAWVHHSLNPRPVQSVAGWLKPAASAAQAVR